MNRFEGLGGREDRKHLDARGWIDMEEGRKPQGENAKAGREWKTERWDGKRMRQMEDHGNGRHEAGSGAFGGIDGDKGRVKDFLDMIAPGIIEFKPDWYVCGNTYRCVWALREYPTMTEEQAILRNVGEMDGVTLKIECRQVTPQEERRIIANAASKNRMKAGNTDNLKESVTGASNLEEVSSMLAGLHRNREPLFHVAVFLELSAKDEESLKTLQTEVMTELNRAKLNVDRLILRQKQGFLSVSPAGRNRFKEQYERVLPAGSVANLYPFNYSGKTDRNGFYLGRDRFGSNIIVDFNQRTEERTNANILILGNAGQGKSYLMKLILTNMRESGMRVICLDPEHEYRELTENLGGTFLDLTGGDGIINMLEPKAWDEGGNGGSQAADKTIHQGNDTMNRTSEEGESDAFREGTKLSQHLSFLKDFFRTYRGFTNEQLDVIEIFLARLYEKWGINDGTDFSALKPTEYPVLSDFYDLLESEWREYGKGEGRLYSKESMREILLGIHSMCKGTDAKFFNGHTNIGSGQFVTFGVKGLLQASTNLRDAMLFNVLSYMSNELLTRGNTVAAIDEFYLFLSNLTAVEYVRNFAKRVRKKDSSVMLASQNLEDFNLEGIREYTKPLFAIPTHAFLFNAGTADEHLYRDSLQLEKSEYDLIRYPQRGVCLYKCGTERYLLEVHAPEYKEALFGKAGGR